MSTLTIDTYNFIKKILSYFLAICQGLNKKATTIDLQQIIKVILGLIRNGMDEAFY